MFIPAVKDEARLRMLLAGPPGSGKTFSALSMATELAAGGRIAVIDTEFGTSRKYADMFSFDLVELRGTDTNGGLVQHTVNGKRFEGFHPDLAVEYIRMAEKGGYAVIVLDSATHFYKGPGGLLDIVQTTGQKKFNNNTYAAWNEGAKIQARLVDAIVQSGIHVIVTTRTKVEYKEGERRGQMIKVGTQVEQREGWEYEFDVVMEITTDHVGHVTKSRCFELSDRSFKNPGPEVVRILNDWLATARRVDNIRVDDALMPFSDEVIRFVRAMRKASGVQTEESFAEAVAIINDLLADAPSSQIVTVIGGGSWGTQMTAILKNFLGGQHREMTIQRLRDMAAQLPVT